MHAKSLLLVTCLAPTSAVAFAKLPAPSDEVMAKAAESAARTAHGTKLANVQLCQSMDKVAGGYHPEAKMAGRETKPATTTAACDNPGPFAYSPAPPASGAVFSAPAPTVAAAAAAPAALAKK